MKVIKVANYNHLQCQHRLHIFQRINYFSVVTAFPFLPTAKFLNVLLNSLWKCQTVTEAPYSPGISAHWKHTGFFQTV